jgi:hypothetical protein
VLAVWVVRILERVRSVWYEFGGGRAKGMLSLSSGFVWYGHLVYMSVADIHCRGLRAHSLLLYLLAQGGSLGTSGSSARGNALCGVK